MWDLTTSSMTFLSINRLMKKLKSCTSASTYNELEQNKTQKNTKKHSLLDSLVV